MVLASPIRPSSSASDGGRLVCNQGRELPLRQVAVRAEAGGGIARTVLVQTFENAHSEALRVAYKLPLPADGAVSGFRFQIGEAQVVGEIDAKAKARARFEAALAEGKTAAILDQERSSLFTQEVGNIPPHTLVVCETVVDQPLAWLDQGAWEWRFPTVVGPRYTGGQKTPDAFAIAVDVADPAHGHLPVRATLCLRIDDRLAEPRVESPSHPIERTDGGVVRFVDDAGMRLDRDVVVRWPVATPEVGLSVRTTRTSDDRKERAHGLLTVVPPRPDAEVEAVMRDLTFLIDTSGSMSGRALQNAAALVSAMIDTLTERDQVELVEFSWDAKRWRSAPVAATPKNKREAIQWVRQLKAGGGTEMESAIRETLSPLRQGSQRQVVLISDGYIGFEARIIRQILDALPRSCRLHTVGVGSAVNRTLLSGAARAGAGVEIVVGLGEDPERAAQRLLARTVRPLVTELEILGSAVTRTVPRALPDLYAGAPALIAVQLDAQGGELLVRGKMAFDSWEERIFVPPINPGVGPQGVRKLFAREWVEDLETERAGGADPTDTDAQIERIGLEYQISTRLTSWVAISRTAKIDPNAEPLRETMPHELAYGLSAEGLGLRAAGAGTDVARFARAAMRRPVRARPAKGFQSMGGLVDDDAPVESRAGNVDEGAQYDMLDSPEAPLAPRHPAPPAPKPSFVGWALVLVGLSVIVAVALLLWWLLFG